MQEAIFGKLLPFGLIKKIAGKMRITKNQPVFPTRLIGYTLLHKGTEWRHAGTRTNHDNWLSRVIWQTEIIVMFYKYAHSAIFFYAIR